MPSFRQQVRFLDDGIWPHASPVKGSTEWDFCDAVQTLWTRYSGSRHSIPFPDPAIAPFCTVAAVDTEYVFRWLALDGQYFEIPWFCQVDHDELQVELMMAMPSAVGGLEARVTTGSLEAGADTVSGDWSPVLCSNDAPPMGDWIGQVPAYRMAAASCYVTPTIPANRMIWIRVGLQRAIAGIDTTDLAVVYAPKLVWAVVRDRIADVGG